ncbi:DUF1127 domain-containing protein [Bradyrhizobium sp. NP1]|jgi:uncharacterized protein YjiS (DUF1127 family)|uniref:DUF1127 domain-containing protein n=1 Tax=Bradyrhizobium sp. NP1 TaxID=3049772 RepID=UPI0025A4E06B|nr:DUF1127 domain-containing protein [Bradyrhizobium sp. NP1]WJR75701.1 DUF1127 domain-containing protein [Bradyrhizobium sp. NP1]
MTLLSDPYSYSGTTYILKTIRAAGRALSRLINGWIAAIIAQREYQAGQAALRRLGDRELRDIGIYRGEIDCGLPDAAKTRELMQNKHLP